LKTQPNQSKLFFKNLFYLSFVLILMTGLLPAISVGAQPAQQTTNLALNKPVTCSPNPQFPCAEAVDGNLGTRWSSAQGIDPQWIYVDLGATTTVTHVILRWEAAYGKSYQIQTSNDATNWTNIFSTTTGDGGVDDLTGLSGSGRYVRMNGTVRGTGFGYSLWEYEIYGSSGPTNTPTNTAVAPSNTPTRTNTPIGPTNTPTNTAIGPTNTPTSTSTNTPVPPSHTPTNTPAAGCGTTNVAQGKPATASSVTGGNTAAMAVDGNAGTRWESAQGVDPQWIYVDLSMPQSICHVKLNWEAAYGKSYQIQTSTDAATWTTIYSTTTGDGGIDDLTGLAGSGRYVRMNGTVRATQWGYSLWEFEIYTGSGSPTNTPTATATRTNTPTGPTNTPTRTPTTPPLGTIVPLYNSGSAIDPVLVQDIGSAIVTRFGDRARDRHAREANFMNYDHYLPLYWEFRTVGIEIVDTIAKGGTTLTATITTLHQMDTPDFRAFYLGSGVLTNYSYNIDSTQLDPFHYQAVIDHNYSTGQPLHVGDRMEIEFSQFILPPLVGRTNYYGTAVLYIVGTGGLVPWEGQGANLDSFPITQANWLGGTTTLPRNYSNEPIQAFKQTAGNISPTSIQPFMLGRRIHHTDFGDGSHSEPGNPIFVEHMNQLGPRYSAHSCLSCHNNNGHGLPPGTISTGGLTVEFFVNNAPWADVIYSINGNQQAFRMDHDATTNNNTWIVHDIPGGATVQYNFTIGNPSGGQSSTPVTTFTMVAGSEANAGTYGHTTLEPALQYVFKVGSDASGASLPSLGKVLQPFITSGSPEAGVTFSNWTTTNGTYGDGSGYSLRSPNFTFTGVVPPFYSARIAPQLVGMGLLEAIDESTIAALADPNDANGDGISGRMQTVIDPETGQTRLGRFGWKATQARLTHQIASALNNDIGVTSPIFPNLDCGSAQGSCGSGNEITNSDLAQMARYVGLLGVQARRNLSAPATTGQTLFTSLGCVKCHTAQLTTGPNHPWAELRNQTILPYTDLLLHDMGPGLASNMGEANASGAEWRTSPLWNLSYAITASGGESYLHDGRARTLAEAILWHGGEANAAKEAFRTLSAANRDALIAFLLSL
jgi:CxxC motif-containing protein (DUF1111 family)